MMIEAKNKKYISLSIEERLSALYDEYSTDEVLVTSSFGASSAYLLGLIAKVNPEQKIHFIDTTYSFPETISYKKKLAKKLGLQVVDVKPDPLENEFTLKDETWSKNPDFCCSLNKVNPLQKLKSGFKIWVSGLMAHQNSARSEKQIFELKDDILKFYPLIDSSDEDQKGFIVKNNLPAHPLQLCGYNSIGCFHCTKKGQGRDGRWADAQKTECGLH